MAGCLPPGILAHLKICTCVPVAALLTAGSSQIKADGRLVGTATVAATLHQWLHAGKKSNNERFARHSSALRSPRYRPTWTLCGGYLGTAVARPSAILAVVSGNDMHKHTRLVHSMLQSRTHQHKWKCDFKDPQCTLHGVTGSLGLVTSIAPHLPQPRRPKFRPQFFPLALRAINSQRE